MKKKQIGSVYVDSGQLMITDPCYLKRWKNDVFVDLKLEAPYSNYSYSYDGACNATMSPDKAGVLNIGTSGILNAGLGIAFSSGYGDGEYPVFATYNKEGRIVKVEIVMG
jgi:hypothetical protein